MNQFAKTRLNRVRRLPKRSHYDRDTVYQILDEALICHVGFVEDEQPIVIPTIHARRGDILYLHGAIASRLLKHIATARPICVTVTLVDGLVLARSTFHHSINYRSAVVFGQGRAVEAADEKWQALEAITEHIARGRWQDARRPNDQELQATLVVALTIDSASAKVRTGPPIDDEADYALPVWAGVLPLVQLPLSPLPDSRLAPDTPLPDYVMDYRRPAPADGAG